jgi:hypothetical protein
MMKLSHGIKVATPKLARETGIYHCIYFHEMMQSCGQLENTVPVISSSFPEWYPTYRERFASDSSS